MILYYIHIQYILYDYKHIAIKEVCECKITLSSYLMEASKCRVLRLEKSKDEQ